MEKFIKNKTNIILSIILVILTIIMFYYSSQKEGFNEDEIFSYGSSNYAFDNLYQPYAKMDVVNQVIIKYILKDNWISNISYYLKNKDKFFELYNQENYINPIWKQRNDAKEYLTIQKNDVFNYLSVIYNQSRDVHPPLFYILVHFVSTIFFGQFTKYIIAIINITFFLLTCIIICKIFKLYKKERLAIIGLIIYGLSIGAISTVIFQRMYTMLGFWITIYTYISLKIAKEEALTKKNMKSLGIVTILGFLTQYYFCIVALVIFIILLCKLKEKKKWISKNLKLGILGIIIFPASIYHIFFSYRGVKVLQDNYFSRLKFFIEETFKEFNINNIIGYIILVVSSILLIYLIMKKRKEKDKYEYLILSLPLVIYYLVISKSAPYLEQRYILPVLPILVTGIVLLASYYISKIKIKPEILVSILSISILTFQIYGIYTKEPDYLYKGYNECIKIADEYREYQFIYIGINKYNHIKNLPEFYRYKESLIINNEQLDLLEKRNVENKFIICIKKYLDINNILNNVLEKTNATNYRLLLECKAVGFEASYYLIEK